MAFHTNTRRVFARWERAVEIANAYGMQTGWKHRVVRAGSCWRVERDRRRAEGSSYRFPGRIPGRSARSVTPSP